VIHLDLFDQCPNDLTPPLPICFLQLGIYFSRKQVETAEHLLEFFLKSAGVTHVFGLAFQLYQSPT
jgi:hypothetical protein